MSYKAPEPFHVYWDSGQSMEGFGNRFKKTNQAVTIWWFTIRGMEDIYFYYSELKKDFNRCMLRLKERCEQSNIPPLTLDQDMGMQEALRTFMKDVESNMEKGLR